MKYLDEIKETIIQAIWLAATLAFVFGIAELASTFQTMEALNAWLQEEVMLPWWGIITYIAGTLLILFAVRYFSHRTSPSKRTGNKNPQTSNQKPQTSNLKPKTSNLKPKTSNLKPKTKNQKPD